MSREKKRGGAVGRGPDRPGVNDPGRGRRLGVDVGSVRVGVALSDPSPVLATPLVTLSRDERGGRDIGQLAALVKEHEVVEVVVGLPRT
ncbi:MAG TPA: Holliday junction resolvase RuvX, partial [Pseudonocardiaceae bacterium]